MIKPDQLLPLLRLIAAQGIELDIAVIGGVAAIAHGVYRATLDLDFLVDSQDLDLVNLKTVLQKLLQEHENVIPGLEEYGPLTLKSQPAARPGNTDPLKNAVVALLDSKGNRIVDFLGSYWKYDREALDSKIPLEGFEPLGIVDAPSLILMKIQADSPKDRLDIYEIFQKIDDPARIQALNLAEKYGKLRALEAVLNGFGLDIASLKKGMAKG